MKKYTADFETATWKQDETWVWGWAICEIGNDENLAFGNNIESFMEFCENSNNSTFYFHNLKFDGEFIIYYLLTNDFIHVENKDDIKDRTFTTLISDMGQFYNITVYFRKGNKKVKKVTFFDSLKIIPFPVADIAKSFNLEISKLELNYNKERPKNHVLTKEEKDYITNDVKIVAQALKVLFDEKLERMTQGSNALYDFKHIITENKFNHYFPELDYDLDKDLRKSYRRRIYLS